MKNKRMKGVLKGVATAGVVLGAASTADAGVVYAAELDGQDDLDVAAENSNDESDSTNSIEVVEQETDNKADYNEVKKSTELVNKAISEEVQADLMATPTIGQKIIIEETEAIINENNAKNQVNAAVDTISKGEAAVKTDLNGSSDDLLAVQEAANNAGTAAEETEEAKNAAIEANKVAQNTTSTEKSAQAAADAKLAAEEAAQKAEATREEALNAKDAVDSLSAKYDEAVKDAEESEKKATALLESAANNANSSLTKAQEALDKSQTIKNNAESDLENASNRVNDAQNSYNDAEAKLNTAKEEYRNAEGEYNKALVDATGAELNVVGAEINVAINNGELDRASKELTTATKKVEELESAKATAEANLAAAKSELEAAKEVLDGDVAAVNEAQSKFDKANTELNTLNNRLETAKGELQEAEEQLKTAEENLAALSDTEYEKAVIGAEKAVSDASTEAEKLEAEQNLVSTIIAGNVDGEVSVNDDGKYEVINGNSSKYYDYVISEDGTVNVYEYDQEVSYERAGETNTYTNKAEFEAAVEGKEEDVDYFVQYTEPSEAEYTVEETVIVHKANSTEKKSGKEINQLGNNLPEGAKITVESWWNTYTYTWDGKGWKCDSWGTGYLKDSDSVTIKYTKDVTEKVTKIGVKESDIVAGDTIVSCTKEAVEEKWVVNTVDVLETKTVESLDNLEGTEGVEYSVVETIPAYAGTYTVTETKEVTILGDTKEVLLKDISDKDGKLSISFNGYTVYTKGAAGSKSYAYRDNFGIEHSLNNNTKVSVTETKVKKETNMFTVNAADINDSKYDGLDKSFNNDATPEKYVVAYYTVNEIHNYEPSNPDQPVITQQNITNQIVAATDEVNNKKQAVAEKETEVSEIQNGVTDEDGNIVKEGIAQVSIKKDSAEKELSEAKRKSAQSQKDYNAKNAEVNRLQNSYNSEYVTKHLLLGGKTNYDAKHDNAVRNQKSAESAYNRAEQNAKKANKELEEARNQAIKANDVLNNKADALSTAWNNRIIAQAEYAEASALLDVAKVNEGAAKAALAYSNGLVKEMTEARDAAQAAYDTLADLASRGASVGSEELEKAKSDLDAAQAAYEAAKTAADNAEQDAKTAEDAYKAAQDRANKVKEANNRRPQGGNGGSGSGNNGGGNGSGNNGGNTTGDNTQTPAPVVPAVPGAVQIAPAQVPLAPAANNANAANNAANNNAEDDDAKKANVKKNGLDDLVNKGNKKEDAGVVDIADDEVPLGVLDEEEEATVSIDDEETPLAADVATKKNIWWWWIPVVAAAVTGTAGKTAYDKKHEKGLFAPKDKKNNK